jgi:hypothetical protein
MPGLAGAGFLIAGFWANLGGGLNDTCSPKLGDVNLSTVAICLYCLFATKLPYGQPESRRNSGIRIRSDCWLRRGAINPIKMGVRKTIKVRIAAAY